MHGQWEQWDRKDQKWVWGMNATVSGCTRRFVQWMSSLFDINNTNNSSWLTYKHISVYECCYIWKFCTSCLSWCWDIWLWCWSRTMFLYFEDMTTMVEIGLLTTLPLYSSGCSHLTYVIVCDFVYKWVITGVVTVYKFLWMVGFGSFFV